MHKMFFGGLLAALLYVFAPVPLAAADLLKPSPEEVIKLHKLDSNVMAYRVAYTWSASSYRFALVEVVTKINVLKNPNGGSSVTVQSGKDTFIVQVPKSLPDHDHPDFPGFIKVDKDGKVATFHPVTGNIVPYE